MKPGDLIKSKFLRGDRVALNDRVLEAFSDATDFGHLPLMGALYLNNPEDPVRYFPLRGLESNGRNWPMDGSLGWVIFHRQFPTPSARKGLPEWGVEINVEGATLIVTENCLDHYP